MLNVATKHGLQRPFPFNRRHFASLITLMVALFSGHVASADLGPIRVPHGAVVGSWRASIEANGVPFWAIYVFHVDESMAEADSIRVGASSKDFRRSPGLGTWKRTSWRQSARPHARAKFQSFEYDDEGKLQRVYTTRLEISVERNRTLSGTVHIVVTTPDGSVESETTDLPFTATKIRVDE